MHNPLIPNPVYYPRFREGKAEGRRQRAEGKEGLSETGF